MIVWKEVGKQCAEGRGAKTGGKYDRVGTRLICTCRSGQDSADDCRRRRRSEGAHERIQSIRRTGFVARHDDHDQGRHGR